MCKQGHISSSPWLNEWGSSPGLETTWCLSRTSFGSMTMTGRAAMTGNVTRIRRATMTRNPITPVVVKVKVRRQLSHFIPPEMNMPKCICSNIFVQMYFSKCICQNVFFSCLSISLIKCLKGQKCLWLLFSVKIKRCVSDQSVSDQWQGHLLSCLWTAKYIFFVSLHLSDQMSQRSEVSRIAL